jgi:hypothetical protein
MSALCFDVILHSVHETWTYAQGYSLNMKKKQLYSSTV